MSRTHSIVHVSRLKSTKRAAIAAASLATLAGPAAGSASAQVMYQCVPATQGQAVVSGGIDGTCPANSTLMRLPKDALAQQRLLDLLPYVSVNPKGVGSKPTITFSGANVQIVNGAGTTQSRNGTGNLVLGYNEQPGEQTGSHSMWVGWGHTVKGYGGLISGLYQRAIGDLTTIVGGRDHDAIGTLSLVGGGSSHVAKDGQVTVLGGLQNEANGLHATAYGGRYNKATGLTSVVSGGRSNLAAGSDSVALGGRSNSAMSESSSAVGGCSNVAGPGTLWPYDDCTNDPQSGGTASVFGGKFNQAATTLSSIVGGERNKASALLSTVAGGQYRSAVQERQILADGALGPKVLWARIDSTGKIASSSTPSAWVMTMSRHTPTVKGYYFGVSGHDLQKCSVSVQPIQENYEAPATVSVYPGDGPYVLFDIKRIRQGSWPIAYDRFEIGAYVIATCP